MPAERVMQLMVQNLQGFAHRSSLVHLAGLILRRADRSPTGFRGTGQKPNSGCDGVFFQTKTENFSWALKTAGSQISGHKTVIHMPGTETLATALNFPKRVLTQRRDRSSWVEEQLLFRTGQGETVLQEQDTKYLSTIIPLVLLSFWPCLFSSCSCVFLLFRLRSQAKQRSLIRDQAALFRKRKHYWFGLTCLYNYNCNCNCGQLYQLHPQ